MKVVILKDTPKVGRKYEVKEVANGFAMNHLIPQGLAEVATDKRITEITSKKVAEEEKRQEAQQKVSHALELLPKKTVEIKRKANEQGSLFAAVTLEEVAQKLSEDAGVTISVMDLSLPKSIKEVGEYTTTVHVGTEEDIKITLQVVSEE